MHFYIICHIGFLAIRLSRCHGLRDDRFERGSPSVSAAGPGCKIKRRLDLVNGAAAAPPARSVKSRSRLTTFSGRNFFPHHEPTIISGRESITSAAVTMRSLADLPVARSPKISSAAGYLNQFRDPGYPGDHRIVPFFEIDLRPAVPAAWRAGAQLRWPPPDRRPTCSARRCAPTSAPERVDHVKDFGDGPLVEAHEYRRLS